MSAKELTKLELIQHVCDKRIRQIDAAQALKLSRRQIQRLVNLFRQGSDATHRARTLLIH